MLTRVVTVGSSIGLHARPAAIIANAVADAGVLVTLSVDGVTAVDAGSALMIMTLGATKGTQITVNANNQVALDTIARLIEEDLDK